MSHYTTLETQIRDEDCLIKALSDLGYTEVERGKDLPLYGYAGDRRPETADVVVRRTHIDAITGPLGVGGSSNDVGFKRQANGTYTAIVSDYDHKRGFRWDHTQGKLTQRYGLHAITKTAAKRGQRFQVHEEADGRVRVVVQTR